MSVLDATYDRLGGDHRTFRCCDTSFRAHATGIRPGSATAAAKQAAETLQAQLDAFDAKSTVSRLNRHGAVTNTSPGLSAAGSNTFIEPIASSTSTKAASNTTSKGTCAAIASRVRNRSLREP